MTALFSQRLEGLHGALMLEVTERQVQQAVDQRGARQGAALVRPVGR